MEEGRFLHQEDPKKVNQPVVGARIFPADRQENPSTM